MSSDLVAAVDLGTNTALLLVARSGADGALEIVEDRVAMPRLGEGLAARGTLDPAAVERTLEVLSAFATRLAELGVERERARVVSTAVLRRARDARDFLERARARTGLSIEIVSGEEEARLGRLAVAAEGVGPDAVIVDIGGGSTEVSCPELGCEHSLSIGAVVLHERARASELESQARAAVTDLPAGLARDRQVVVLGGTGLNAAALALGLERFDHERAEGAGVSSDAVSEWADRLARMVDPARSNLPIESARAAILPAGFSILSAVLQRLGAKSFRVTGRGLRFGIVRELLARGEGGKNPEQAAR